MNERDLEQLLRMAREADRFERELHTPTRRRIGWLQPAIAACLVFAGIIAVLQPGQNGSDLLGSSAPRLDQPIVVAPTIPELRLPYQAGSSSQESHVVVALYRKDSATNERCPECWCVARWSADWSDGRSINEIEDHELVDDSMARSCVLDPQRVVVVGLSGPAASMPTTDQQALELSLCLLGETAPTNTNCVPVGVDYCMASWSK